MRKLSKILAVILSVSMLFGTVGYAAEFSDVTTENAYYEPIKILSAFGIITGYEDGTFGPDKDVTRAEFATMLMRAMAIAGMGSSDPAGTPFTDLSDASWAISNIRTAYDLGIINGMTETTFEPNSNVTYEQALKMLVFALNYGGQAATVQASVAGQPWYYGSVLTARNLGLLDNVTMAEGQPAKRAHIAQMIFNALDVKMLEKVEVQGGGEMYLESTQTWLKDKLKITKSRGDLVADETNTMSEDGTVARTGYAIFKDDVNGGTITIAKNGISLSGLLGKTVDYYYKTDAYNNYELVLAYSKSGSNSSLEVDASNINRISGSYTSGYTVEYYESDTATRTKSITVRANPIISINGEVKTGVSASELTIESGSLEFISDGGVYNKINVESLETYVVKSVNKTDKYIVDMYRASGSNTLYIDDDDSNYVITMKNTSGSTTSISSVSQYNVLTVRRGSGTSGRTSLDVTVSSKNVSGTIKGIDDDIININGTEYTVSTYLNKYGSSDVEKLSVGDSCKAYLDKDGKIAYITKTASSSTYFGYIGAAGVTSDDRVRFAIISQKTTSMGSPYLTSASKLKIDGETYSDSTKILNVMATSAQASNTNIDGNGATYSQLVKYTINSLGEITEIDTVTISDKEDPTDETTFQVFNVARKDGNEMSYKSSSYDFIGATNTDKFRINSSTQVFLVPLNRSDFESYGRKSSSFFKDGYKYVVEAYNVTGGLNIAEAVVVYETESTEAVVEKSTPLFVIKSISQTTNSDGYNCDKVTGYQISSSGTVTDDKVVYTSSIGVISGNYSVGDVIMYVTDNKGYLKADSIVDVLDADNFSAGFRNVGSDKVNNSTYYCELYTGLLVGADVDGSTQIFDLAEVDTPADCATGTTHSFSAPSSTKFFVYDPSAKDGEKITLQDSYDITSLASYNETVSSGTPEAAKLFVYKYNNTVRAVIIVK